MTERGFAFHQWTVADIEKHFDVNLKEGLSQKRAHFRLVKNGENSLESINETSALTILLRQFGNIFILLLFVAAIISFLVDGFHQSVILFSIIILNVVLGFSQEYGAHKALDDLKETFKSKSKVLRDGSFKIIPSEELVSGDVVALEVGDKVPADIRIIESESLSVNESALTGESLPVIKSPSVLNVETVLADRVNMLFGSTVIVSGRAKGVVINTGRNTEFGKIADLVEKSGDNKTPLEKQVSYLGKVLSIVSLAIALVIFTLGFLRGFEVWPLLTLTIALLVGAVPESLPTVITLSLAIGVSRMAKRKAIVRKLTVVETLGTINIIASDKTGTLTNNELKIDKAVVLKENAMLGDYQLGQEAPDAPILNLFLMGVVCSNINLKNAEGEILGDPVEVAIANAAKSFREGLITKSGLYKRESEIPFDSENKYMAVTVRHNNKTVIIVKGSAEAVLSFCSLPAGIKRKIKLKADTLSKEGLKVIALASKSIGHQNSSALTSMEFLGLLALVDEPAEGIKEAIGKAIDAGIRPIMITGDHPETARFVAEKVGLKVLDDEILIGKEMETLLERELKEHLKKVKIFARITPEDKINIVRLLQKSGYSVVVTGDGVNDAPALKEANVGISMGIKGTDVAKDSSDIVLSDDKFETIISAVEYGRAIYDNIRNAIVFLVSSNFHVLFLIGFAFLLDLPTPLITIQILWINMITDSLPAIALAFEKPSPSILKEKPRSIKTKGIGDAMKNSFYLALAIFAVGLVVYLWGLNFSSDKARTLLFTFSVFAELIYCFSIRSPKRIWQDAGAFFANKFLIVTLIISGLMQSIIFIGPLRGIFKIVPLNMSEILIITVAVIITFFLAEVIHYFYDRRSSMVKLDRQVVN